MYGASVGWHTCILASFAVGIKAGSNVAGVLNPVQSPHLGTLAQALLRPILWSAALLTMRACASPAHNNCRLRADQTITHPPPDPAHASQTPPLS